MVALDSFYPMTGVTEQLAQWQKFAPYYFGDGVVWNALNGFTVQQHTPAAMNVDVLSGRCFIQGVFGENGTTKTLTIAAADATNPRIDRVVIRCDTVAQDLEVLVLPGTPAVSPSPPAILRSATQTDYSLCQVLVGTTVTTIVSANITDETQWASAHGIPHNSITATTTLHPYGSSSAALTAGLLWSTVTGTTTITSIATAPEAGALLFLNFAGAGCTVQKGNNIAIGRNYVSGTGSAALALLFDATNWFEIGRSGEQAPAHQYYGNPTGTAAPATFAAIVAADLPSYGTTTMGSLSQGVGVAYTQNTARSTQFGKLYQLHAQLSPTGTGTAGSLATLNLPAGVSFNLASGDQVGLFRIDGASSWAGLLTCNAGATGMIFEMALNPMSFWGVTPNVSFNATTSIWISITAEIN